ncbi:MAG TPA: lactate utilization protein C [Limnobacter sp.]|nr:lactate utilization protein C [Limnobacter sp.]
MDTASARAEILARIRNLQGRPASMHANEVKQARDYIERRPRGPGPGPVSNLVGLFEEKSKAMLCTVSRVNRLREVPAACAGYLAKEGLVSGTIAIWPALAELDWSALGHSSHFGAPSGNDLVGISAVACAVAETGTLVFASRPDEPASTHLLPETHIAIVKVDQVVHTMEDAFSRLRAEGRVMPRALNFVSGPSRTADIEQTIVLGAHGPYRVHLILVEGSHD